MARHHSWVAAGWYWKFWQRTFRKCERCGAKLRLEPAGPRRGQRYSYCAPGDRVFRLVERLPSCELAASFDDVTTTLKASISSEELAKIVTAPSPMREAMKRDEP